MRFEVFVEADDTADFGHADIEDVGNGREVLRMDVTVDTHQFMERTDGPTKLVLMGEYVSSDVVVGHRNKALPGGRL